MATSFQFASSLSCFSAIKWSVDNRIAVCTDDTLKILSLLPAVAHSSEQPHFQQSFIPVNEDIYDIPNFTENQHRYLIKSLSRDDYHDLVTDTVMNPNSPASVPRRGFCGADWSPQGGDAAGRCILAGLSHDFRLCLFSQKLSVYDWHKMCDLTEMYRKSHVFKDDKLKQYKEFQQHCHDQAVVAISWSSTVFMEAVSGKNERTEQKYSLLAACTKTGTVILWRINLPCTGQSECNVLHTLKPYSCQPLCMSWSQNSGILAIGYTDGQIHALKIDINDPSHDPTVTSIFSESDLMRISCLAVVSHPEIEGEIILANKEQYVLAFNVSVGKDFKVMSENCVEGENILHGTGFAGKLGTILLSSADGITQLVQLSKLEGSLHLSTEKLQLDISSALQNCKFTYSWLIYGVATSPNNILMAYVASPSSPYDHLILRRPTLVQVIPLNTLQKKCMVKLNMPQESETKTAAANMDVYMDQKVMTLLKDETVPLSDVTDLLESFRSCWCSSRNIESCFEDESLTGKSLRDLKIKRYQYLVIYHTRYKKNDAQMKMVWAIVPEDEAVEEERRRRSDKLLELIHTITDLIVAIQISSCARYLAENRTQIEFPSQVKNSLKRMLEFLKSRSDLADLRPDISETISHLRELLGDVKMEEDTCLICSCKLCESALTASCTNGHSFGVCSKTLLICDSMDYRTCRICHCLVLSKVRLKEFPWLPGDENRCSLCDGCLL